MLRLSKLTDYAVVVLARLEAEGGVQTAPGLAASTGIAEPTVSKVLKTLGHSGLVEGLRGARGGYRLTRPLSAMPLSEVIVAIDGPIALTACVDGASGGCEAEAVCPVRGRWDQVNEAIRSALSGITLAELAGTRPNTCGGHHALERQSVLPVSVAPNTRSALPAQNSLPAMPAHQPAE